MSFALKGRRVWVAGHNGMVGSAICRRLATEECEILKADRRTVDLRRPADVERWMAEARPEAVFVAAARVGGVLANATYPADFIYDNLMIETNVIHAAWRLGVGKLLFLGSSCIYPRLAPQPIPEEALLDGPLEPTNQWYAIAKIAGIKLCEAYRQQHGCDFISAMPTNLYGPNDNFDLGTSHVLPALIAKIHDAKTAGRPSVEIWGSGKPLREFLHVDDLADATVFLMRNYSAAPHINVGAGKEITIAELARLIAEVIGYEGRFTFDPNRPDGTPRKLLDVGRLTALGWQARIALRDGIAETYAAYRRALEAGAVRLAKIASNAA
jgi:GDP-L-fucose synthase